MACVGRRAVMGYTKNECVLDFTKLYSNISCWLFSAKGHREPMAANINAIRFYRFGVPMPHWLSVILALLCVPRLFKLLISIVKNIKLTIQQARTVQVLYLKGVERFYTILSLRILQTILCYLHKILPFFIKILLKMYL